MEYIKLDLIDELETKLSTINDYYILNGGTDLLVLKNELELNSYPFLDISAIKELNYIKEDDEYVYIGANVKYHQLNNSPIIQKNFSGIIDASLEIGSSQIRNLGSLVGNICNSSPGGDSPVILNSLDAEVLINDYVHIDAFITGFRTNILQKGEYIKEVRIKKFRSYSYFKKYAINHSNKVIIANASIAIAFNIINSTLCDVKVTFGACDVKFREIVKCNQFLNGKSLNQINKIEWLNLVDNELKQLTNEHFYQMKSGHLKGCAIDVYNYLMEVLK